MRIRAGGAGDDVVALGLLDGAVAWLVARGRTGQWGEVPMTGQQRWHERARDWVASGGMHMAEIDGEPVGALVVGTANSYVPAAVEPELYVNLLVTDRARQGHGIGTALLDRAREIARERGVTLLRVDCYGGDDRALVRWYESQGFVATDPFTVDQPSGPWPGQLLEQRL